ncbi:MAG: hypothetical protein HZC38_20970 [Chloroflexi bacterium]|nr:hypothetical protein [Chloroflexota bacterium]
MDKVSLKAFWEKMEKKISGYSAEELRSILRAMAEETLPQQRQVFLDKLKPQKEIADVTLRLIGQDELLSDIDDFARELKVAIENAEPNEYREDYYNDYYDDEENSEEAYEEFVEPLTVLFERTDAAFDHGNFSLARAAYKKLFEATGQEDDYGRGISITDLPDRDAGETRARYLRAIYETTTLARRPKTLLDCMQEPSLHFASRVKIEDIIQISPKPLPDEDAFFKGWITFLRKQSGADVDEWLREAVRLSQGTLGLAEFARTEGVKRPRAYLDWFTALEEEGKHREILVEAQKALQTLSTELPIRAAVADHLCAAATKLKETQVLREGRWEAFTAKPTLSRLLDLWDSTPSAEQQLHLMLQAVSHLESYLAHPPRRDTGLSFEIGDGLESPARVGRSELVHACLLAGNWQEVHQLAAKEGSLGWSNSENTQGLAVPFFLIAVSTKTPDELPASLSQLWQWGLQTSTMSWGFDKNDSHVIKRLERAYKTKIPSISLSNGEQNEIMTWCLETAMKRMTAIVKDQHRGSYDKAAVVIAACAETLRLRGADEQAETVLAETRNRFPRHRAFLAELDAATQSAKGKRR